MVTAVIIFGFASVLIPRNSSTSLGRINRSSVMIGSYMLDKARVVSVVSDAIHTKVTNFSVFMSFG